MVKFLLSTILWSLLFPITIAAEAFHTTTRTSVIFNTLCAKCHEGECSGRLSFDTGSKTARRHISHYAGNTNLTVRQMREFCTLLNYMKKKCAIYMPDDGNWKPENLSHFALPSYKGYFIPLGELGKGQYTLDLQMKEASPFRVEILTNRIESLMNRFISGSREKQHFHFSLEKPTTLFVRIRSRVPLHITTLEIKKAK